jgi:hypothetical protein
MKIVAQFDPTAPQYTQTFLQTPPSGKIITTIQPGPGKMVLFNQSLVNMILTFPNSGYVDYAPAGSYRIFDMELPNWNISWSGIAPLSILSENSGITDETSLVTVVVYEQSENIPTIEPATSFVNPFDVQLFVGNDPESATFSGTGTNAFTITSAFFNGSVTYLSAIYFAAVQTASSSDHADLTITVSNLNTFGGSWKQTVHLNSNNNNYYYWPFNPAMPCSSPSQSITITGTLSNVAGAGVSVTNTISALFYVV